MTEVLTVKEVSLLLKVSRQQVRKMIQRNELPAIKIGREYRVSSSHLERFLKRV